MHNPLAAVDGPDLPTPSPWESLAAQARAIADLADRYAALAPADLAPANDHDALADLDSRADAIRSAVAACRRFTWQALYDSGRSAIEIGRMWGVSRQRVSDRIL